MSDTIVMNDIQICSICPSLSLAPFEVSIVATSLVAISADLQNFSAISWLIAAHLPNLRIQYGELTV
jgi:hypothetical protein